MDSGFLSPPCGRDRSCPCETAILPTALLVTYKVQVRRGMCVCSIKKPKLVGFWGPHDYSLGA